MEELEFYKQMFNRAIGTLNSIRMSTDKEMRLLEIDIRQAEEMLKKAKEANEKAISKEST